MRGAVEHAVLCVVDSYSQIGRWVLDGLGLFEGFARLGKPSLPQAMPLVTGGGCKSLARNVKLFPFLRRECLSPYPYPNRWTLDNERLVKTETERQAETGSRG